MPRYFNSRPREGANRPRPARGRGEPISIPAPARGRTWQPLRACLTVIDFNSRPREGANKREYLKELGLEISIPAPARGRTITLCKIWFRYIFQFPPPRGGEPLRFGGYAVRSVISIPAPARGRTCGERQNAVQPHFNSRPREGANPTPRNNLPPVAYFNSRPREGANFFIAALATASTVFQFPPPRGGERNDRQDQYGKPEISIPAPARGRTCGYRAEQQNVQHFNSRPREGANR